MPNSPLDQPDSPWPFETALLDGLRRKGHVWSGEHIDIELTEASIPLDPFSDSLLTLKKSSWQPEFEDWRRPETPPPVFQSTKLEHMQGQEQRSFEEEDKKPKRRKRPKVGPRGVSFSKSILGLRKDHLHIETASPNSKALIERGVISDTTMSIDSSPENVDEINAPANAGLDLNALKNPEILLDLTRASTTSSVEEWLGLKKAKPDLRVAALAEQKRDIRPRRSLSLHGNGLPRISTFRTEREYRALNKTVSGNSPDPINGALSPEVVSTVANVTYPLARRERPRFFRSRSRKSFASLESQTTTPSVGSADLPDPFSAAHDVKEQRSRKSPSRIHGSLLRRHSRESSPGPVLAKSRRTGTFDEAIAPPSQPPPRPIGAPEFRNLNLHPMGSPDHKAPSSKASPCDTSSAGMNHYLLGTLEKSVGQMDQVAQQYLQTSSNERSWHRFISRPKSQNFLTTEARRVTTPPPFKVGKGNRLMGYFWDIKMSAVDQPSAATINMTKTRRHIPFLTAPGAGVSFNAAKSAPCTPSAPASRSDDWFRVRADVIMKDNEQDLEFEQLKATFDLDVPEHFSTSPLCPANPKHPSAGTGICVYHGRGKRTPKDT